MICLDLVKAFVKAPVAFESKIHMCGTCEVAVFKL